MRWFPQTILGRTLLVLLVGLGLSHLVALAIYAGDRRAALIAAGGRALAERTAAAVAALEEAPPAARPRLVASFQGMGMRMSWSLEAAVRDEAQGWQARLVRGALVEYLGRLPPERVRVAFAGMGEGAWFAPRGREGWEGMMGRHMFEMGGFGPGGPPHLANLAEAWRAGRVLVVSLRLGDGSWLNVATPAAIPEPLWSSAFFVSILLMTALTIALSVWAVRRATRPLAAFADAAERLGKDVKARPLAEVGPREVRQAAGAFNDMQRRIQRFVEGRTQMLAAISHDLRTPITRLRLRAEFVEDDEQRAKMLADLTEMEAMIVSTLAFARDEAETASREAFDLAALLESLADDAADAGKRVSYEGPARLACEGRPAALRRAFSNLIDNAVSYGGAARVTLTADDGRATVAIDDDGPGLDEAELEKVFAPFYRVERSRSRSTGGTGLGLAVVRSVVRGHGGEVSLANRPEGGLRATVVLPRH